MSYYRNHGDIIYVKDLDARRKELFNKTGHLDEDEHEELRLLVQFRADVCSELDEHNWLNSPGIIADDYFPRWCDERMKDQYGVAVIDALDKYLDFDSYEDDQRDGFIELDFDGVTYLIDKEC
jgi:hypothetical protein